MSARKWPIYTMPVDSWFQDASLPRTFPAKVRRYEEQSGKKFRICRWDRNDPNSPKVVRRIA